MLTGLFTSPDRCSRNRCTIKCNFTATAIAAVTIFQAPRLLFGRFVQGYSRSDLDLLLLSLAFVRCRAKGPASRQYSNEEDKRLNMKLKQQAKSMQQMPADSWISTCSSCHWHGLLPKPSTALFVTSKFKPHALSPFQHTCRGIRGLAVTASLMLLLVCCALCRRGLAVALWRPAVGAFEVVDRGRQVFIGQGDNNCTGCAAVAAGHRGAPGRGHVRGGQLLLTHTRTSAAPF